MAQWTVLGVLALALVGYVVGAARARGAKTALHSRPAYHGAFVLIWTALPALIAYAGLSIGQPAYETRSAQEFYPEAVLADEARLSLIDGVVESVAEGLTRLTPEEADQLRIGVVDIRALLGDKGIALASDVQPFMVRGANALLEARADATLYGSAAIAVLGVLGFLIALARVTPSLRARNSTERVILVMLMLCSAIAILTTVGIVFSMVFETTRFFGFIQWTDFFFGTTFDPGFQDADGEGAGGEFGLLPLLWGTLYISLIALLIAVPIGLYAAIYMSEFASPRFRSIAKPVLEVLAGVPTIVYGFFALITVGPLIRDFIAIPLGLGTSGSSVMTAGIVMGVMIIPFVSSLSDDIINAVPQSLRDGSYGLGATKAETIRQVVLPAALPGIVGAVLLAASRAIGETMIVVLAAGVSPRISANPFEEMTTITVRIVTQLTGDIEFTSPQALVAFALGLTLFFVTLGMNVFALRIVRKYREQYE